MPLCKGMVSKGGEVVYYCDPGEEREEMNGMMEYTLELEKYLFLVYGSCIDSIRVTYDDNNGKPFPAEKHGGIGGTDHIGSDEILVSVSGHYCPVVYGGSPVIRSLTFKSNKRTFGPFGVEEGTPFNFFTNGGRIVGIVGFNGRSGWFLDSLGFCLSSPKQNVFQRFQMMYKGFNPLAITNGANKTKGSQGHWWGI